MKNKIRINIEEEKVLRLEVPTDNGMVVINNPSTNFKNELITMLVECITENKIFDERKIMMDLINHCTNVEFEGDLFEATNLSHEVQLITNEILIIFQEILSECYQLIEFVLHQTKNEMMQNGILKEKENVIEKAEEIKEATKPGIVSRNTVRKPQRRRKI